jgi:hypothetical protein
LGFWERLSGIFNPPVFQKAALGPSGSTPVVFLPAQPLMVESYLVGDGELGKAVLAGELEGTFTTAVGEFGKISEWPGGGSSTGGPCLKASGQQLHCMQVIRQVWWTGVCMPVLPPSHVQQQSSVAYTP